MHLNLFNVPFCSVHVIGTLYSFIHIFLFFIMLCSFPLNITHTYIVFYYNSTCLSVRHCCRHWAVTVAEDHDIPESTLGEGETSKEQTKAISDVITVCVARDAWKSAIPSAVAGELTGSGFGSDRVGRPGA